MSDKVEKNDISKGFEETRKSFLYIQKKIERVVAALHLITDHVGSEEPVKPQIRHQGLALVRCVSKLVTEAPHNHIFVALEGGLLELRSFLAIAYHSRSITQMNYSVVDEECHELLRVIEHERTRLTELAAARGGYIPTSFFDVAIAPQEPSSAFVAREEFYKGHINNNVSEKERDTQQRNNDQEEDTSRTYVGKESVHARQKDRRAQILSLLQRKDNISIKDVSSVITDCSEKTLQRELLVLVQQGVLKKKGERRWSTYSLR